MNKAIGKWCYVAAAAVLFCVAPCALAQVSVELTGANPYYYYDQDFGANVSVGPYVGNVGTNMGAQITCDDYADEVVLGEKWSANTLSFSSLSAGNVGGTLWGATLDGTLGAAAVVQLYLEAGYLTEELITANATNPGHNSAQVAELQYALWGVFYLAQNSSSAAAAAFWKNAPAGAQAIYNALASLSGLSPSQFANLVIVTPLNNRGQVCGAGAGCAQEYFELVPEGGSAALYLLLAGASCLGAMFFRRRQAPGVRPGVV